MITMSDPGRSAVSALLGLLLVASLGACSSSGGGPEVDNPDAADGGGTGGKDAGHDTSVEKATPPDVGTPVSEKNQCIVPLGDSITQGDAAHLTYRYWLWEKMVAANLAPSFVGTQRGGYNGVPSYPDQAFDQDHEGHWGRRADEILAGLPDYLTKYVPGIVLLHAGTNDCRMAMPETDTINEIGGIIDTLRQRNSQVVIIVAKILPLLDATANTCVSAFNDLLPALVDSKNTADSPVVLVDQHMDVVPALDLYDGIHPNEASEQRLADRWLAALQPFLAGASPCQY